LRQRRLKDDGTDCRCETDGRTETKRCGDDGCKTRTRTRREGGIERWMGMGWEVKGSESEEE
jgi:hypothetical protein